MKLQLNKPYNTLGGEVVTMVSMNSHRYFLDVFGRDWLEDGSKLSCYDTPNALDIVSEFKGETK